MAKIFEIGLEMANLATLVLRSNKLACDLIVLSLNSFVPL